MAKPKSPAQLKAQANLKKISDLASQIQRLGGSTTKTVTTYKMKRSDAVKQAARTLAKSNY